MTCPWPDQAWPYNPNPNPNPTQTFCRGMWPVHRVHWCVCVCSCCTKISVAWEDWGWLLTCGMGCGLESPPVVPTIVPSAGLLFILICRFSLLTVGAGRGRWVPVKWRFYSQSGFLPTSCQLVSCHWSTAHFLHFNSRRLVIVCVCVSVCVLFRSLDLGHDVKQEHRFLPPHTVWVFRLMANF